MADNRLRPSRDSWPIAAALLQFPPTDETGIPIHELSPERWRAILAPVRDAGYTSVEIPSAWIRLGDMPPSRITEFQSVLTDLGLSVPGISVVRESIIHPTRHAENLAFSHRTIDAAAELGIDLVCFGLHDSLTQAQGSSLWFWTAPGTPCPQDPAVRIAAVRAYRELADHAATVGVEISLELYEDTFLGTADSSVRFLEDIDHPAVGLNPDIGNLIRRQGDVEDWRDIVIATIPHANYWHVKNYYRMEDPHSGIVLTHPSPLNGGVIDYRAAVQFALVSGFTGAFVVEHYGGDGLSVGAENEHYLRSLLPECPSDPVEPPISLLRRNSK